MRALILVSVCLGFAALVWLATHTSEPPTIPSRGSGTSDAADDAVSEVASTPVYGRRATQDPLDQESEKPDQVPAMNAEDDLETGAGEALYPEGYTGIRDTNMVELYKVFKMSLERSAEQLQLPDLTERQKLVHEHAYAKSSAYVALIQARQFRYCGYDAGQVVRPLNTRSTVYHYTSMGGMHVIMEISRAEFPELFELEEELGRLKGK